jgi:hypothetical protein
MKTSGKLLIAFGGVSVALIVLAFAAMAWIH